MHVLICGRQGGLCEQLADRLSREKGEIYYISGNRRDDKLSKNVFQEYHFPYLNENINQIVIGARPDTMIVTGAFDENYSWRMVERDATEYVIGMTSLFMAAQNAGVKRLIYISSTEVFENNKEDVIDTNVRPQAESARQRALLRVEKLLEEFNSADDDSDENRMETIILRLPPVFGDYSETGTEICLRSAVDYIQTGKIQVIGDITHTGIYYKDAVEAVIRCVIKGSVELLPLYQIRGLVFTEEELAEALLQTGWNKTATIDHSAVPEDTVLQVDCPAARIDSESENALGLRLRYDLNTACDLLCKECLKKRRETERSERETLQVLPIAESVAMALVTYFATVWINGTWVGDSLNLFALYVLVLAVTYGTSHGLFASILAGFGLLLSMAIDDSFLAVVGSYTFYLQFLQLIATGVIAGYIRDKYARKNKALTEDKRYLTAELNDLMRISDNTVYVKNIYEKRLLGYENSLSRIYELTTQMDFMESQKVTFQAVRMISELMEMKDVAIYSASRRSKFLRLSAATTELASSCGKSLKFDETSFLYESLHNKNIYINREFAVGNPTFGAAVYSDDQLLAIILVWTKELKQVNLYASDTLAIACRLIEKSMARAFLYEESLRNDTYVGGTNIMKPEAFIKMMNIYEEGYQSGLLIYTTLKIVLNEHSYEEAAKLVRDTDYVGVIGETPCIILSNSTMKDAEFVIKRYSDKGMEAVPVNPQVILADAKALHIGETETPEEAGT